MSARFSRNLKKAEEEKKLFEEYEEMKKTISLVEQKLAWIVSWSILFENSQLY